LASEADLPIGVKTPIKVETGDHVVTLKGTLRSPDARTRAEEIARTMDEVKPVVGLLPALKVWWSTINPTPVISSRESFGLRK
jgi:hypothetical protein